MQNAMNGHDGHVRYAGTKGDGRPTGKLTATKVKALLEYQGYRCALTGRQLTTDDCEADHIIPVRDGGGNVAENIQLVVKQANKAKGTMTQDQFVQLCRDVKAHCG